jgi:putative transposase
VSSRVEQFAHLVWSTHGRCAWITAEHEPALHGIIQASSVQEHCSVIAIGGMEDHVHVLARLHASVSLARLAGVLKATSSGAIRRRLLPGSAFAWQSGYGAFSVSPRHVGAVERYVSRQKEHHLQRQTNESWEPEAQEPPRGRSNGPQERTKGAVVGA